MEILSPGVLLNLLEQKTTAETTHSSSSSSSLLQIRSIVPVFSETDNDDLFPKHGFHLKVADSSHAMFVSLPQEQQDMVLGDHLRLGQLIFADNIERTTERSVPVLRGIRPVPGRHACLGNPEELENPDEIILQFSPSSQNGRVSKRRSWIAGPEAFERLNNNENRSSITKMTSKDNKPLGLEQAVNSLSNSIPRNLLRLRKEVEKSRDLALLASVEALQQASVSERLLKCLVEFSKLKSSSLSLSLSKENEKHPSLLANGFFELQRDLAQTGLILQSLTSTRKSSSKQLFADRNKAASSWISAALASDLDPLCAPPSSPIESTKLSRKMKGVTTWKKGSSSFCSASLELANSLRYESKLWFLGYAEKYLDELSKTTGDSVECLESAAVAETMCEITKLGDWLDSDDFAGKECSEAAVVAEARGRVRKKIYGVLLKMAQRTALAWGHMKTAMVEQVK